MKETSKASLRRSRDPAFVQTYMAGVGLDIRPGNDPLSAQVRLFPRLERVETWQGARGDIHRLPGVKDQSFDFVHASHCLADTANPAQTLARWLDVVKPGGYVVATLPDEDLYGKGKWPSAFNTAHRASFTICKPARALGASVNVLDMVQTLASVADCERVALIRDHYDESRSDVDQTADAFAECAIEVVLRKRDVPTWRAMLKQLDGVTEASACQPMVDRALRTYPYHFELYHRAMMQMLRWGKIKEMDALWDRCVARLPNEHLPRLYQALHLISRGDLQRGFALREKLMAPFGWQRRTTAPPPASTPQWKGESLVGKSIAIWSEFGLGDEIFFMRFARILRERAGARRVTVVCQAPLVELFTASGEADAVIDVKRTADMPEHDYWVFPHAIPAWLPLDLENLPQSVPYLRATGAAADTLLDGRPAALKVGVVFKGAPTHENDHYRSLPSLSVLDDLFAIDGIEFFSLQKGAGADEAAAYAKARANFHDVGARCDSMTATAAAIDRLDLVITVDTSVAHVAAAMGKPVWLLLPFYCDWRWHFLRDDSPWYPHMRLFRSRMDAGWTEVIARVRGHLLNLLAARPQALNVGEV